MKEFAMLEIISELLKQTIPRIGRYSGKTWLSEEAKQKGDYLSV